MSNKENIQPIRQLNSEIRKVMEETQNTKTTAMSANGIFDIRFWETRILQPLALATGCDRITIRIIGQALPQDGLDADHNPFRDSSGKDNYFRRAFAYYKHIYLEEEAFSKPLSKFEWKKEGTDSDSLVLKSILGHCPLGQQRIDDPILQKIGVSSWICVPLIIEKQLVGIMTLDKEEGEIFTSLFKSNYELHDEWKTGLQSMGDALAALIDKAFHELEDTVLDLVDRIIVETTEPESLLERVTDEIIRALDEKVLFRRHILSCEVFRPPSLSSGTKSGLVNEDSLIRWYPGASDKPPRELSKGPAVVACTEKEAQISYDVSENLRTSSRIHSILAVPVKIPPGRAGAKEHQEEDGEWRRIIAVITVNSLLKNSFSHYDARLVEAIAHRTGTAIERARQIKIMEELRVDVGYEKPLEEMLKKIVDTACELTYETEARIFILSGMDEAIHQKLSPDDSDNPSMFSSGSCDVITASPDAEPERVHSIDNKLINFIVKNTDIVLLDQADSTRLKPNVPVSGAIATSIRYGKEYLGIFVLWRRQDSAQKEFRDAEKTALRRLSVYAGVAYHNSETKRMLKELENATQCVMQSKDALDALNQIARLARELVNASGSYVVLLEPDQNTLRLAALALKQGYSHGAWPRLQLNGRRGVSGYVTATRQAWRMNNPDEQHREYVPFPLIGPDNLDVPIQSELAVALLLPGDNPNPVAGEPAMGVLVIDDEKPGKFSDIDLEITRRFATIAAIAIKRYSNPPHQTLHVDTDPRKDSDIFIALKFKPEVRRKWVETRVEQAARHAQAHLKNSPDPHRELIVKSAAIVDNIPNGVWTYIARCELMIADMSGDSINVFYEIGLAHALNKPVILIGDQQYTRPPADLGGLNILNYTYTEPDLSDLDFEMHLSETIQHYLGG